MHKMERIRGIRIAYHLVDIRNLKSVQAHGLLSTQKLVERSSNVDRSMLRQQRHEEQYLDFGAFVRDQRAMQRARLAWALRSGVSPEDWFELLNSKIFFWLDLNRLNRHRHACNSQAQVVLAVDAGRMLDQYALCASVSPINSGHAMRTAVPRNRTTFVAYSKWVDSGWDSVEVPGMARRPSAFRPAELAITGQIPDLEQFVIGSVYLDASIPLSERHIITEAQLNSAQ